MPAPAAVGALVGVAGRLVGKKGAQAAAGAAAKEGAEEVVEGGAKAVAGKVQQGLGMVQANQQQAQQKQQNMQQRLQDATREGASTGSTIGKGEFFHPSVGGYIEQREGRRGPVTIMAREEGEVETPVPQTEMKRGQPMVEQRELGALPDGFFSEHAHERLTDRRRTVDENESQQVQRRISEIVRQHTDSTGMYKKDSPRDFAIRTHIFDDHRQPDETLSMSNGDSIVGIVRPNSRNSNYPSLHTVMLRRSELSHAPQPFKPAELRVNRVFNNHGMSNSELRRKAKMNKSEAMDITWRLLKERKSPEAMRHKREYDKKYESSPERVKYREDLNRERRRRGIYGSGDHMDVSHTEGGGLTLESQHANRGRHFKDRGTLRPFTKSLREDLELLRNLLAGPMDEQDKKIGLAMVGMLEERHENDDNEEEEEKPKQKQTGFLSTLLR